MSGFFTRRVVCALATAVAPFALTACAMVMRTVRPASSRAELAHNIDSLTSQPVFRNANWGVLIVNPRTGERVQIQATIVPKFSAGSQLKAALKPSS